MQKRSRRLLLAPVVFFMAAVLAGCATVKDVSSDVSSFGDWPADRAPGTYAFERLPSQQAQAETTDLLEAAAAPALERAGFRRAAEGQQPDVLVQVGARDSRNATQVWDDPLWWYGGYGYGYGYGHGRGYGRYGPWGPGYYGYGYGGRYGRTRYESQVALLIRDRATGKPLHETRAAAESYSRADAAMFGALFSAALVDFPRLGVNPRRVVVELAPY